MSWVMDGSAFSHRRLIWFCLASERLPRVQPAFPRTPREDLGLGVRSGLRCVRLQPSARGPDLQSHVESACDRARVCTSVREMLEYFGI